MGSLVVVGRKGLGENDDGGEGRERTAPHFDPRAADCEAHDARGGRVEKPPRAILRLMWPNPAPA